jgi:hypothetical protein
MYIWRDTNELRMTALAMGHPCVTLWSLRSLACGTLCERTERGSVVETNLCAGYPPLLPLYLVSFRFEPLFSAKLLKKLLDGIVIIRMQRNAFVSALRYENNSGF